MNQAKFRELAMMYRAFGDHGIADIYEAQAALESRMEFVQADLGQYMRTMQEYARAALAASTHARMYSMALRFAAFRPKPIPDTFKSTPPLSCADRFEPRAWWKHDVTAQGKVRAA